MTNDYNTDILLSRIDSFERRVSILDDRIWTLVTRRRLPDQLPRSGAKPPKEVRDDLRRLDDRVYQLAAGLKPLVEQAERQA